MHHACTKYISPVMARVTKAKTLISVFCCASFFLICIRYLDTQHTLGRHDGHAGPWRSEDIAQSLKTWLQEAKTGKQNLGIEVRMFNRKTKLYRPNMDHRIEYEDDDDEKRYKGGVTVGHFNGNQPQPGSIMWQWRGGVMYHGFLYGKVDRAGKFTGDDIAYIYPDLETGLRGRFINGQLVGAIAVEVVAYRMNTGVLELRFAEAEPLHVTWARDVSTDTYIGAHPKITEPHERKSVYASKSKGGKGDGVFARRSFHPGDLVSYFNGIKTTEEKMFHEKMTSEEESHAAAYYFGLGSNVPAYFNIPEEMELDIPDPYRSVEEYRTTLGHKVNHQFDPRTNVEFDTVHHPVFGVIVCLIASKDIEVDEELFVNYHYGLEDAAQWYRDLYDKTYETY